MAHSASTRWSNKEQYRKYLYLPFGKAENTESLCYQGTSHIINFCNDGELQKVQKIVDNHWDIAQMEKQELHFSKKGLCTAIPGAILAVVCCFTPILVITLGTLSLGVFTPYFNYLLLITLLMLIAWAFVSYGRWKKVCKSYIKKVR
jgi:mercuric ion transport protein